MGAAVTRRATLAAAVPDDRRARQLIEMTIDSLAEVGFVDTTLAEIAGRAGVSAGLVAHYFGDKNRLLEAAFRALASRLRDNVLAHLQTAHGPRERLQAIIDANLAAEEFNERTSTAWLAFWGQVLHAPGLGRIQAHSTSAGCCPTCGMRCGRWSRRRDRQAGGVIAAMIDGVWLRGALSGWTETDSDTARSLLTSFVDNHLATLAGAPQRPVQPSTITPINPATGEALAEIRVTTAAEIDAAVAKAKAAQPAWAATAAAERGRILRRAADLLRERNPELARLETLNTGKPIQETLAVDVLSGADCLEYYAGVAATIAGQHIDLGAGAFGYTRREPLGIVAGIGAWNYPLQIACWKAAPALACGNAMIFKPPSRPR